MASVFTDLETATEALANLAERHGYTPGSDITPYLARLTSTARLVRLSVETPEVFGVTRQISYTGLDEALITWLSEQRKANAILEAAPSDPMLPWTDGPLKPSTLAAAVLTELFACTQDLADLFDVDLERDDSIGHVAYYCVRTRDHAYRRHGVTPPAEPFRFELEAPSGECWSFGPRMLRTGSPAGPRTSASSPPDAGTSPPSPSTPAARPPSNGWTSCNAEPASTGRGRLPTCGSAGQNWECPTARAQTEGSSSRRGRAGSGGRVGRVLSRLEGLPSTARVFEGQEGHVCLRELFGGCRRLAVYHMVPEGFRPSEPLSGTSSLLEADTRLVVVSRAPYAMLEQYRQFLGPDLPCYSSSADLLTGSPVDTDDFWDLIPALSFFRCEGDEVVRTATIRVPGLDFLAGAHDLLEQRVRRTRSAHAPDRRDRGR